MISRGSLRRVARRRTKGGRGPLNVEALEPRYLLSAEGSVVAVIVAHSDLEATFPLVAEECSVGGESIYAVCAFIEIDAPEPETPETVIATDLHDDIVETSEVALEVPEDFDVPVESVEVIDFGAIDSSELIFFSMPLGGEEFSPDDAPVTCDGILLEEEIAGDDEVIEGYDEAVIDPVIFSSFSGPSDDASGLDVDSSFADFESHGLVFEMVPAPEVLETRTIPPESPTLPPSTPKTRAFTTFGQSPNAFNASLAAAFAGLGSDRSGTGDDDLFGGRRRGRR